MDALGLLAYCDEQTGVLSGGTRQKLSLTLVLMHDPQVLLDEPYQGFDWETYLRFWTLAGRLRDAGQTVLLVTHLAHDIERLDEAWRLVNGRLHAGLALLAFHHRIRSTLTRPGALPSGGTQQAAAPPTV